MSEWRNRVQKVNRLEISFLEVACLVLEHLGFLSKPAYWNRERWAVYEKGEFVGWQIYPRPIQTQITYCPERDESFSINGPVFYEGGIVLLELMQARDPALLDIFKLAADDYKELCLVAWARATIGGANRPSSYTGFSCPGCGRRISGGCYECPLKNECNDLQCAVSFWHEEAYETKADFIKALSVVAESAYANNQLRDSASQLLARAREYSLHPGYIYLVGCEEDDRFYKIGRSQDPSKRLSVFSSTLPPFRFELLHTIEADNDKKAESELHVRFQDKRHNGEWFTLDEDDIGLIKSFARYELGEFCYV